MLSKRPLLTLVETWSVQNTSCDTKVKDRRAQLLTTQPIMTLPSTPTPAIQSIQCPKWRQNGVSNDDVLNVGSVLSRAVGHCRYHYQLLLLVATTLHWWRLAIKINWMMSAALWACCKWAFWHSSRLHCLRLPQMRALTDGLPMVGVRLWILDCISTSEHYRAIWRDIKLDIDIKNFTKQW